MKIIFLVTFILMAAFAVSAQPAAVVKTFEQNKANYTREHLVSGEDASSGYDYLFYKSGADIVKVRSIWSASHTKELRVEDSYFEGGSLVLLQRMTGRSNHLKALIKGRDLPLTQQDELYLKDSKLVSWIDNKKPVANTDPRWAETEKSMVEHAKAEIENYYWLKEDK